MLSKAMEKAFNDQIREEIFSSYLYLSMAAWFETKNLKGMASWMRVQVEEEKFHAEKFFDYINERQGTVKLQAIEQPAHTWKSPLDAFKAALKHEQHITGCINELAAKAFKEKDRASQIFIDWYVNEQVEEEASVDEIIQQLSLIGDNGHGLYMLDKDLGTRTFTPPPATE